jgi:hypothetical protein
LSSKSSINNPKLLVTVEETIQRLILPELAALKREERKKQCRRERLMDNKYDKDVPVKVRRKHRSRSKIQDAEQSDPRDGSLPPLPTLTEYRARRVAGTSIILQDWLMETESQKIIGTPPFMEKTSFE